MKAVVIKKLEMPTGENNFIDVNTESTYSEDSDRILIDISDFGTLKAAKAIIDERIRTGKDIRKVYKSPAGEMYFAI